VKTGCEDHKGLVPPLLGNRTRNTVGQFDHQTRFLAKNVQDVVSFSSGQVEDCRCASEHRTSRDGVQQCSETTRRRVNHAVALEYYRPFPGYRDQGRWQRDQISTEMNVDNIKIFNVTRHLGEQLMTAQATESCARDHLHCASLKRWYTENIHRWGIKTPMCSGDANVVSTTG
jgi:hypothetical protein